MAAEEEEQPVPDSGAIFTFGKSNFAENCPSKFWLKNDKPAYIACGDEHTALVTGNGKLYVFGSNVNGQLGIGSGNVITKPTCVKALKSEKIKLAACGRNHTLVSTAQGKVYSSGWNSEGQLGLGDTTERSSFHEITFFNGQSKIKQLSAGSNTSAVLTADGKLYMWGENSEGQLGLGSEKNICSPRQIDIGKAISWISCGYYHSAFVTQDGELYTFGEPESGKLGLPAENQDNHKNPQRVPGISRKVKMVSCGGGHTIAVTDKEVYAFGVGRFGQLGHGTDIFETNTPKVVDALRSHKIRYVACGENHTAVITDKGLLYTFGDGRYGKLGSGEENFHNQFSPTLCMNFLKFTVQSVACGGCHMLVFAVPRPKESELVIDELKENFLTVNGDGERSTTLQRSPSARERRRVKKHSPEQIRDLTRTLPPLNSHLLDSLLPVTSRTVPPILNVRQVSSESSARDSSTASKTDEKQRPDLVKSFSADDESDAVSQQSFGGTTDLLNMTHALSMTKGSSTFSPVQKRKETTKNENSEEDEVEDEEEDEVEEEEDDDDGEDDEDEVVEDESKDNSATEKIEPKADEGKTNEHVNTAEKETKINQEESTAINKAETEQPKTSHEVNSSEKDMGKTTFLEKTKRLSLFKRRSTTSQKSLRGNGNVAAVSSENSDEMSRSKENKDGKQNGKPENAGVTEPLNEKATDTGRNAQDRKSKSATCLLL